eukprot:12511697-Alexandrium_andersonii.AAC.1
MGRPSGEGRGTGRDRAAPSGRSNRHAAAHLRTHADHPPPSTMYASEGPPQGALHLGRSTDWASTAPHYRASSPTQGESCWERFVGTASGCPRPAADGGPLASVAGGRGREGAGPRLSLGARC